MSTITEPTTPPNIPTLRIKAIQSLLIEKGYIQADAVDEIIDIFEHRFGPKNGAKVVAKAWTDPDYKQRLLTDATAAIAELGFTGLEGAHMYVAENTADVHNMVVCTLCSCYPWPTLGLPPTWYKAPQYRSRAVIEPRSVLAEFGVTLPANVEIRVWDSNAEIRYMVLPQRPSGSEHLTEAELAELVTRNAMIGTDLLPAVQS
ncbi:nitrile hydratase subunit alpha [Pantoea cypripedii]|uniref:nitrile hydratase n=1 Tax=Pantoea cypripedii TaxID=55209 RepID=A0A1X1ELQ2_PANCY|nr:nitrile hydratase subunit alpha [Pantoea cypripedii]MBP2200238.1 nitrile hydratase [Pantoea cypripedii]ORM89829.1 nitrile hydratase subunit alpha [Pantoea cypripedii]